MSARDAQHLFEIFESALSELKVLRIGVELLKERSGLSETAFSSALATLESRKLVSRIGGSLACGETGIEVITEKLVLADVIGER
ncbi:MAG TPA: hypothetical protein VFQ61_36325 [Polyangiaceae bacterium]|nr:hypothetical protein [Polyangiaceae bacterium]